MSDITITLDKKQAEVLNTLLSAEIMKLDLHYGAQKNTERQSVCYSIRDMLIKSERGVKNESNKANINKS